MSVEICAESDPAPTCTPLSMMVRNGGPAFDPAAASVRRYWNGCTAMPAPTALKRLMVSRSIDGTWAMDQRRSLIGVTALTASKVAAASLSSASDRLCCWKGQPREATNLSAGR